MEVFVEGTGSEAIVMIHGWPDTHRLWQSQVEALRAEWRCIRFTLPGFELRQTRRAYSLAWARLSWLWKARHRGGGQWPPRPKG